MLNRGNFEWDGDWSDKSDLWKKHPAIRLEMRKFDTGLYIYLFICLLGACNSSLRGLSAGDKGIDDGSFYMSWTDFLRYFDGIDVCFVERDMGSVKLDVKEDFGLCGAFVGCIIGKNVLPLRTGGRRLAISFVSA